MKWFDKELIIDMLYALIPIVIMGMVLYVIVGCVKIQPRPCCKAELQFNKITEGKVYPFCNNKGDLNVSLRK